MKEASLKETPLELTKALRDVSVTERAAFRSCRRRWYLETIDNLTPKQPNWALAFGTGMHAALEAFYKGAIFPRKSKDEPDAIWEAHNALNIWHTEEETALKKNLGAFATDEVLNELWSMRNLGHTMLDHYPEYDSYKNDRWKVKAVEGTGVEKLAKKRPPKYPEAADVLLHESGRFMVPIVHPDTKKLVKGDKDWTAYLTARIDLLVERPKPHTGLWIVDHKTAAQAPSDRGIDFDDQITGYCYVVWRLTGIIPKGVIYNVLIKQEPKEPRMTQQGLSTAKDQLTLPSMYRQALVDEGLMKKNKVESEKHAACYEGLLARGWDPFFRRYEVRRNKHEIMRFEERLLEEYMDMSECLDDTPSRYPNLSTWWCPGCPVNTICQAMEDGSDYEHIIETRFMEAEDRKAA